MRKLFLLLGLLFTSAVHAQLYSGLIAPARATDWTGVGVTGGVPSASWPQCPLYSGYPAAIPTTSTIAQLNTASVACAGTNSYIPLATGTFNLTGTTPLTIQGGTVLRGFGGGGQTKLVFASTVNNVCGGGSGINGSICIAGTAVYAVGATPVQWTGGYTPGLNPTITLSSVNGIIANKTVVVLDQCTDGLTGDPCAPPYGQTQIDNGNYYNCEFAYVQSWSASITYSTTGVVTSGGNVYKSAVTGWSASVTYTTASVVVSNGNVYQSTSNGNLNHVPPNATWWTLVPSGNLNQAVSNASWWTNVGTTTNATYGCAQNGPDGGNERLNRGQSESFQVSNVNAALNQVTLIGTLRNPNWASGQTPEAWIYQPVQYAGLEDVIIDNTATSGPTTAVTMIAAANCWVKGVSFTKPGYAGVYIYEGVHDTVEQNYFFGTSKAAFQDSEPIAMTFTNDILIQSNIAEGIENGLIMEGPDSGSVIAYNFQANLWNSSNGMDYPIFPHAVNNWELYEGNIWTSGYRGEVYHGAKQMVMLFRNFFTGWESCGNGQCTGVTGSTIPTWNSGTIYTSASVVAYPSSSSGFIYQSLVNSNLNNNPAGTLNTKWFLFGKFSGTNALAINAYNRNTTAVGNVLGTPGYNSHYNDGNHTEVIAMGGGGGSQTGATVPTDTLVKFGQTGTGWGNYDTATGGVRWCGDATDTGWVAVCGSLSELASTSPYSQTKPTVGDTGTSLSTIPSLYLNSKPYWFQSLPWPSVHVESGGGNVGQCAGQLNAVLQYNGVPNISTAIIPCTGSTLTSGAWAGHVDANPAMNCALAIMGMKPDGSDTVMLQFNRANCYGTNAQAATPAFSPVAGTYSTAQTVTISTTTPGAIICWNTTGAPATNGLGTACPNGTLINGTSGTITVSVNEIVYAVAGTAALPDSSVGSAQYTISSAAPTGVTVTVH